MSEGLAILGATGSVGRSTLDVLARQPSAMPLHALTAHSNAAALADLCLAHRPRFAVIADPAGEPALRDALSGAGIAVRSGAAALVEVAAEAESVLSAIVGAAGLLPTLAAVQAGRRVIVANKEPLVMAGELFLAEAQASGAELIPVDSEHNAIFQCLPAGYRCGQRPDGVKKLILTASGGPFREWDLSAMRDATPAQAVAHPNWDMGAKISVDSATMMNKGLEVIEAHWLFAMPHEAIEVVVHPQSTVHSLVVYRDGSLLAQMGAPDMRIPLAHALGLPERIASGADSLDLIGADLRFEAVDMTRFPCLRLAREAIATGLTAPAILNAANEVAVEAFLGGRLAFGQIAEVIAAVLETAAGRALPAATELQAVLAMDDWARQQATTTMKGLVQA
ncbi:1-deoxy-D-xylulose-5-phosphate reductoisomerase [Algiphilus aromaticivorans]|uniref:1-deoxy-D-xylulose-5-phosphate reductoisomerase n=1 Tax=Algiphilus aromaticivorans TaxID=382454 RepID=UPI0005C1F3FF|nr:1-deoxy-D-xylulose-5-phosphate reductoisomerase [Algiphilus aromaticivorans]